MTVKVTGPLFKWFGSKWSSSKHYPAPIHQRLVEPFAGSAGYALRHSHKDVIIVESDLHINTLWRWLIHEATEASIREIPVDLPEGSDIRELGLSEGQALLLKNWQRTNNVGGCWTVSPWGNKPGQWTMNTRSRVAEEFHLVKHWHVGGTDAFAQMEAADRVGGDCTWFIDPPYQHNYKYRGSTPDYDKLGTLVAGLPGQIIVCEAVCAKTGQTPGWLPFQPFRSVVTSRRKTTENHHSKELIYTR